MIAHILLAIVVLAAGWLLTFHSDSLSEALVSEEDSQLYSHTPEVFAIPETGASSIEI